MPARKSAIIGEMASPTADHSGNWTAEERHSGVLEAFLDRAAIEGERAATRMRLFLCSLALVYEVALDVKTLPAGNVPDWIRATTYVIAIGYSIFVLRYLPGKKRAEGILRTSVVLDPLMVVGLLVPTIIDHSSPMPHIGIVHEVPLYVFLLTAVTSGVRLSLGAAKIGIVANGMAFVSVVALDEIVWAGQLPYGPRVILWPAILVLGASLFGWDLVHRMRQLATEGANAMLFAERAKNRLRSYVSEGVAEDAMRVSQISMTGHQVEVAVLFSDLRGFTAYAERLAPDALVVQLNAYFEAMLMAIVAEGGTVDKYIGDAIMVIFEGSDSNDGAARAIRAAQAMQAGLEAHNVARGKIGLSALRQGIGIHFGLAIAGNVGTPEKLQHTVMGDVVNVASRLEGATKKHQTSVFISKETVEAARRSTQVDLPKLRVYGKIEIVGRDSEVDVFTLDDPSSAMSIPPGQARTA